MHNTNSGLLLITHAAFYYFLRGDLSLRAYLQKAGEAKQSTIRMYNY